LPAARGRRRCPFSKNASYGTSAAAQLWNIHKPTPSMQRLFARKRRRW
jgi:hypothetical protein